MKLSVIFPVFNQFDLATAAIDIAIHNLSGEREVEFVILDNGSKEPFQYNLANHWNMADTLVTDDESEDKSGWNLKIVRSEKNIGVYPTFWWGIREATGDVPAFFHSDLMIAEAGWDKRVLEAFEGNPKLGMVGFVGSNEIDGSGGRGLGTCSNFLGLEYKHKTETGEEKVWCGSAAEIHGRRLTGLESAAVEDGCAMIFRRTCLETIPQRPDFPPHHFYDRLLSCEVRERGWEVATLGVGCDHISGQTVNQEQGYQDMAKEWAEAHGLSLGTNHNWDSVVYESAGRQWLTEYKDQKGLVPCCV